jgi:SAM-dependent methyltransferase
MFAAQTIRKAARKVVHSRTAKYIRMQFAPVLPTIDKYRATLRGLKGLEIGGPSEVFTPDGPIPVYGVFQALDNCLYSAQTIWAGNVEEGATYRYNPGKTPGKQIICEATRLLLADATYDCVLASHCLEHLANPLLGLGEWSRVLSEDGILLLILPHKDGTFDWRRPTTTLAHMVADYENGVGEDDLTHLPEVLALHDLKRDKLAGTKEQFSERCLANPVHRAMHHHVFDTMAALQLVDHAGFTILRVDHLRPFHIIILASRKPGSAHNGRFLEGNFNLLRKSPFPSDRAAAKSSRPTAVHEMKC